MESIPLESEQLKSSLIEVRLKVAELSRQHLKNKACSLYMNEILWDSVIPAILKMSGKFVNKNHFLRCAVNNLIKEELTRLEQECKQNLAIQK